MMGEVNIYGVYLPALFIWAIIAIVPMVIVRRALLFFDFYRFVWHRALFDIALYVAILGGVAALASQYFLQASS